ncbi:MAG: hypothetical protein DCC65_14960 [Planctomycetota bacterium]|nr:MAG: hypothetical protein DCC65_14960 [Planctomycetota bacterium]
MLHQYLELPRAVHILCLGMFINRAGTFLIPFLALYLTTRLGYSESFATWTIGVYGLGSICAALLGGHLADHIGRRTVMLGSLLGATVILMIFSALSTKAAIVAAAFCLSFVADTYRPAAAAMIADLVEPTRRSLAYGLMYVAINLGFSVAPVIGGFLAERSFTLLFWGDALTCAIYAAIIVLFISETLPARSTASADATDNAAPQEAQPSDRVSALDAARHILRDRPFLVFCGASLLLAVIFMQSVSTLPLYMKQFGISARKYGQILAINGILITVFQLPMAAWLNRFNRAHLMPLASLLTAAGFGLTLFAVSPWHFAATVVVWTIGEMMQSPFLQAIVSDMAPMNLRARYMGVFTLSYAAAMSTGVPAGGQILVHAGGRYVWIATFVVGLVSALMYWMVRAAVAPRRAAQLVEVPPADSPSA